MTIKGEIRMIIDTPRGELLPCCIVGERIWPTGSSLCMATHIMLHAGRSCIFDVTSLLVARENPESHVSDILNVVLRNDKRF